MFSLEIHRHAGYAVGRAREPGCDAVKGGTPP